MGLERSRPISKMAGDKHSVPMEHLYDMACGKSNGHVIDDVTLLVAGGQCCARLSGGFGFGLPFWFSCFIQFELNL